VRRFRALAAAFMLAVGMASAGCAPTLLPPGAARQQPEIAGQAFIAADGKRLALRAWLPEGEPKAVILALHGFNDYSNFFDDPGDFLKARGIASYAYDQRGFGADPDAGSWAGVAAYARDAADAAQALSRRHLGVPLYMLGSSMGGAVAMVALAGNDRPPVKGVILAAPAVWGRVTMPFYQRAALWLGAHTLPWMTLTGRGLGIVPSDNYEMLVRLGRDPLAIKETRIGTLYGLVNLMDAGLAAAPALATPALILYGEKDQIIPKRPTRQMLESMQGPRRVALYEGGYHMLLRDLPAQTVWKDIAGWIADPAAALRSGADNRDIKHLLAAGR
jgi:acylglycerol lipase